MSENSELHWRILHFGDNTMTILPLLRERYPSIAEALDMLENDALATQLNATPEAAITVERTQVVFDDVIDALTQLATLARVPRKMPCGDAEMNHTDTIALQREAERLQKSAQLFLQENGLHVRQEPPSR